MGNIGRKVAKLADAFGMQVSYWDQKQHDLSYHFAELSEILQQSDVITLHLPLTPVTKSLINESALNSMQAHTLLINTARGGIIDQKALVAALQSDQIGGFAADVLAEEPPDPEDPLFTLPNVLITPHSASLTASTFNEMCVLTVQNTISLLDGQSINPLYIFNAEALNA